MQERLVAAIEKQASILAQWGAIFKAEAMRGTLEPATGTEKQIFLAGNAHMLTFERYVMAVRAVEHSRFDMDRSARRIYRSYVEQALAEGKTVPPEVLRERELFQKTFGDEV